MIEKKKRKWKLFDSQREGKGVNKQDANLPPNLKRFWILYRENFFGRLLAINLLMIIGNFPIIFIIMAYAGVGQADYTAPVGNLFGILHGVNTLDTGFTPSSLAMIGVAGLQIVHHANTFWTYFLYGLGALTLFTWGFVCVGSAYILRNMVMGRPVFLLSDFFDAIRNNWKQGLIYGIIDVAVIAILCFNIYNMLQNGSSFLTSFFFWVNIVLFLLYFIMRWYIYLQIVSFDMKLFKMVKNAAYFVLLGFKRNILALLGILILVGLTLLFLFAFNGYLVGVAFLIPVLLLFSNSALMATYAAWFKIDEIMVIHTGDSDASHEPSQTDAI